MIAEILQARKEQPFEEFEPEFKVLYWQYLALTNAYLQKGVLDD